MADEPRKGPGTDDTSEYSASKAPETKREAEERETTTDTRLLPGGARGAHADVGMSAMDHADVPSEALRPRTELFGDSVRRDH
jgi:hypothetical protein